MGQWGDSLVHRMAFHNNISVNPVGAIIPNDLANGLNSMTKIPKVTWFSEMNFKTVVQMFFTRMPLLQNIWYGFIPTGLIIRHL